MSDSIFFTACLSILLVHFLLDVVTELLNLRALSDNIPLECQGIFDTEGYAKSQQYTRVKTKFELISSAFDLTTTLLFWLLGGFNFLDQIVRGFGWVDPWTGVAYIVILVLAEVALSIPFSVYKTFVLEEEFGFNKTTPKTFVKDRIKSFFLFLILGVPLIALILVVFDKGGHLAWLYAYIGISVFSLLMQIIVPTLILPCFLKMEPLEEGPLRTAIEKLVSQHNFEMERTYVIDGSTRSSHSNAFLIGFGKSKRICLYDTLVEQLEQEEIIAVLAHEIGHYKLKHIPQMLILSLLQNFILFFLLSFFISNADLSHAFFMDQQSTYTGIIFFGVLFTPIEFILSVLTNAYTRRNEFQADEYSVKTTKEPENLANALKKLSKENLSNLTPHWLLVFLSYSHPPLMDRLSAIRDYGLKYCKKDTENL